MGQTPLKLARALEAAACCWYYGVSDVLLTAQKIVNVSYVAIA